MQEEMFDRFLRLLEKRLDRLARRDAPEVEFDEAWEEEHWDHFRKSGGLRESFEADPNPTDFLEAVCQTAAGVMYRAELIGRGGTASRERMEALVREDLTQEWLLTALAGLSKPAGPEVPAEEMLFAESPKTAEDRKAALSEIMDRE